MGGRLLRSLSLFSGIGGLDLSLKGVLKPLVYCEIDPYALAVLNDQMRKGTLHKAVVNTPQSLIFQLMWWPFLSFSIDERLKD